MKFIYSTFSIIFFYRLISSIERDFRKNFNNKEENEYIHKILGYLVSMISNICMSNIGNYEMNLAFIYQIKL